MRRGGLKSKRTDGGEPKGKKQKTGKRVVKMPSPELIAGDLAIAFEDLICDSMDFIESTLTKAAGSKSRSDIQKGVDKILEQIRKQGDEAFEEFSKKAVKILALNGQDEKMNGIPQEAELLEQQQEVEKLRAKIRRLELYQSKLEDQEAVLNAEIEAGKTIAPKIKALSSGLDVDGIRDVMKDSKEYLDISRKLIEVVKKKKVSQGSEF
mmetsp:Transcript_29531/g.57588  ORF Transcript_29531/g.57588 Transcript_29531/m.57588 type:complete len:209 (-) Transcript_29531:205-831(-)